MADDILKVELSAERLGFSDSRHYLGRPCKRGHIFVDGKTWRSRNGHACVLCKREIALAWKAANPERARENTRKRDQGRGRIERRRLWPFALHVGGLRKRAAQKGLPCTLSVDDVKLIWRQQEGKCFWTNRPLDFFTGGDKDLFRPSLDRLEPGLGYVRDNLVWASNFANRARGATSAIEFARVMREFGFHGPFENKF